MNKIREWLRGKKTYLVCVAGIIGAVASWATGDIELGELVKIVVGLCVGMTVRAGITDSGLPK